MAFLIRNVTGGAVVLDDIGLTIEANSLFDLTTEQPNDIAISEDLKAAIAGGTIVVLDPLFTAGSPIIGGSPELYLSAADGEFVVTVHNDPHFRINGGTLNQLDDVDTTNLPSGELVLSLEGSPQVWQPITHDHLVGNARLSDLADINGPSPSGSPASPGWSAGTVYVLQGGSPNSASVVPLFGGSPETNLEFCEAVQDIVGPMIVGGSPQPHSDITVVYNDNAGLCDGQMVFSVDDVFLRNTGDTLDSGTLTIATGANITIIDPPTAGTDAVNKDYVDSIASGLDPKESVRAATTGDVGGTFTIGGGSPNSVGTTITGVSAFQDGFQLDTIGDRLLVKDQATASENGIYVVTSVGAGSPLTVDLQRAADQDGSPSNEVSAGNFTFVENGDTQANTGWVVTGDGILKANVDDINWVQFSEAGQTQAGIGLTAAGVVIDLNVDDLTTGTITGSDELAFHDINGSPQTASGSTTRKITADNFIGDLNIVTAGGSPAGIIVVGGSPETGVARTIEVEGAGSPVVGPLNGLSITDGNGVAGNPTLGLDINGLPVRSDAVDTTDRIAVYNVTTGRNEYYTVSEVAGSVSATDSFVTWQGSGNVVGSPARIVAESSADTANVVAGDGITLTFVEATDTITWSFSRAGLADTAVEATDTFPFFDGSNSNEPEFRSFSDLITDLNLQDISSTASQGVQIVLTGSPQVQDFQLDIGGLTPNTITSTDQLVFFGGSPQQHYNITAANFISDLGLDQAPISASDGIEITLVGSPQVQDVSLDFFSLPDTAITTADIIAFGDVSGSPQLHASRTVGDLFNDLDVVRTDATGIIVGTGGSPAFEGRTITAAGVGLLDGLSVTNGDGIAADPEIGLDIDGTPAAGEDLTAADELIIKNASAGTGSPAPGENQKITGQELADGVLSITNLTGLTVTTIGGQEVLTLIDTTRSNKVLSIETSALRWAENVVGNNDWIRLGSATDALSGYIVPLDATIVKVTAHTADDNGNSKDLDLYIDGALDTAGIVSFTAVSGENEFTDTTLNIDVDAGEKIRLRGASTGGAIDDTVVTIWLKWRG